jgi:hypothetical protein
MCGRTRRRRSPPWPDAEGNAVKEEDGDGEAAGGSGTRVLGGLRTKAAVQGGHPLDPRAERNTFMSSNR